jgi:putative DNA primase/helicase
VIILTGGGVQPIWLIEPMLATEPNASRAEAVGAYVTQRFGGDPVQNIDRVLRLPGFINHPNAKKRKAGQPPMTATLIYPGRVIRYTLAQLEQAWPIGENTARAKVTHEGKAGESADGVDAHGLPLSELDDLTGGMKQNYAPADIDAVAKCCPFIRDTLATGGAGYKEPLWKQTLALAARCKDPEDTAHRLSRGHVGYAREATEQKLAQNHGAGPPLCETIHKLNVPQCKDCVYRILGTTPLNIGTFTSPDAPLVEGKPLVTKLPTQVLWDVPGNRARIMEALDKRLSADPYIFQNGDRLISLRVSPGSAQFANIIDRSRSATGEVIATPAVRDDGDMPAMLETTDADILLIADQDYWMGAAQGRPAQVGNAKPEPKSKRVHASSEACKIYMKSSRTKIGFRPLLGLARVPIIDKEGNLDFGMGYHEATGIFCDRTPILNVPEKPTLKDCSIATKTLLTPYWEYQFEDMALGRALILTFIFTAIERPFISLAPMFGINGASGVGKGKLLRSVSQLAYGTSPRFMTYGFNSEEFDKRIGTMFRIPAPFLIIDNANNKTVANDTLESIITEGESDIRILGRNDQYIHVISRSLLAACGVGLQFSGDMTRRVLILNPIPGGASPETQVFKLDPPTYAAAHRDEMLSAAFTLMRAFRQEGMPKLTNTAAGSFPEWEQRVRDLIMWLTRIDITAQFARNAEVATDKQSNAILLSALRGVFGNAPFFAGDVQRIYDELAHSKRQGGKLIVTSDATRITEIALFEALDEKFPFKPVNTQLFGSWARMVANTYIAGLRLTREDASGNRTKLCILQA